MIYEFNCHDCKLIWEKELSIKSKQRKTKCPKCKKLCEKSITAPAFHMKGLIHRAGKHDVMNFYNEAINDSKEFRDKQKSPYSRWVPDVDKLHKAGQIRKMTEREAAEVNKGAKKVADAILNDTGLSDAVNKNKISRGNRQGGKL